MTKDQIRHAKNTNACNWCGSYGYWFSDHRSDGTLHEAVIYSGKPIVDDNNKPHHRTNDEHKGDKDDKSRSTSTFSNVALNSKTDIACLDKMKSDALELGALVDNGASYSAIGIVELNALNCNIPSFNVALNDIPSSLKNCTLWK